MCICIDPSKLRKFSELRLHVTCVIGAPPFVGALPDAQIGFFLRRVTRTSGQAIFQRLRNTERYGLWAGKAFWAIFETKGAFLFLRCFWVDWWSSGDRAVFSVVTYSIAVWRFWSSGRSRHNCSELVTKFVTTIELEAESWIGECELYRRA
jgi:hypothetical protein